MLKHRYQDLIDLFNATFSASHQTLLICGKNEPIYLPQNIYCPYHRIIFAHGFFASALHEISHWCIAGTARRQQIDYGYWYSPDGRDAATQHRFEVLELAPQALDWLFCLAAQHDFHVSCDNLNGDFIPDRAAFKAEVKQRVVSYLSTGLPKRAEQYLKQLHQFYNTEPMTLTAFLEETKIS